MPAHDIRDMLPVIGSSSITFSYELCLISKRYAQRELFLTRTPRDVSALLRPEPRQSTGSVSLTRQPCKGAISDAGVLQLKRLRRMERRRRCFGWLERLIRGALPQTAYRLRQVANRACVGKVYRVLKRLNKTSY